jgi:hypothetical protein
MMDVRQIWMTGALCWLIGCGGFIDMLNGCIFKLECWLRCLAGSVAGCKSWLSLQAMLAGCCLCWLGILPMLSGFAG